VTTLLILYVGAGEGGQVLLNARVVRGTLRDDMKGDLEGRTVVIERIKAVRGTETGVVRIDQHAREAREGQEILFLVTGAEKSLFDKYRGRPIEFR
jgi:hypothetical protein